MTTKELRDKLKAVGCCTPEEMIDALESGETLKHLGVGDADIEAVEDLHAEFKDKLKSLETQ